MTTPALTDADARIIDALDDENTGAPALRIEAIAQRCRDAGYDDDLPAAARRRAS